MGAKKEQTEKKLTYLRHMVAAEFSQDEQTTLLDACEQFAATDPHGQQLILFKLNKDIHPHHIGARLYPEADVAGIDPGMLNFLFDTANQQDPVIRDNLVNFMLVRFEMEREYLQSVERKPPHQKPGME